MALLFYDTETTGLPDRKLPRDDARQPHLVQLAALLTDDDGRERATLSVIVEPEGYTIPDAVAALHGITTDIAMRCGIPLTAALWPFICLRSQAEMVVAHNVSFDVEIVSIALTRMPKREYHPGPDKRFCTMEASAPIVNLPPTERMVAAGINKPKAPKLVEAYRHFFGEDLAGAHDALVDVRACAKIYFELKRRELTLATGDALVA